MRASLTIVAIAFVLASCGQSTPAEPPKEIRVRGAEQEQLHKLDDLNRAIALKRAIRQSGYRCLRIDSSGYVAEYKNLSMWMATCDDKREWAVFVGPDATVQVRLCKDVARYGLPACVLNENQNSPAA